jgi:dihydrofolate reductase
MKESDMRKMFWQINMTLDGFMEGRGHELDDTAQFADPEFDRYASAMLQSIDQIVLGRVTYELFAGYWPTATGPDAERLNDLPKLVFSRTLGEVAWSNARLARGDVAEEITRLKRQRGGDIALFGSDARRAGADRRVPRSCLPGRARGRECGVPGDAKAPASAAREVGGVELGRRGALLRSCANDGGVIRARGGRAEPGAPAGRGYRAGIASPVSADAGIPRHRHPTGSGRCWGFSAWMSSRSA